MDDDEDDDEDEDLEEDLEEEEEDVDMDNSPIGAFLTIILPSTGGIL